MASFIFFGVSPLSLFFMLSLLTLNVKGFRSLDKQREVMFFVRQCQVDLVSCKRLIFTIHKMLKSSKRLLTCMLFSLAPSQARGLGVVVLNPRLRLNSFSSSDSEGRLLVFNFMLGGTWFKIVSV